MNPYTEEPVDTSLLWGLLVPAPKAVKKCAGQHSLCLMPRDATENIASPILSTHTPDLIPPSHDSIRNFSTISDPATQQCPASFPHILIYIPDTSAFKCSGLGGHFPPCREELQEEAQVWQCHLGYVWFWLSSKCRQPSSNKRLLSCRAEWLSGSDL